MTDAAPTGPAGPPPPPEKRNAFTRFLDFVEWLGNLLPHPVTLFAILALLMVLLSGLFGWMGVAVEDPRPLGAAGRAEDGMITAVSLMTGDGLRRIFTGLVGNFTSFAPLGVVLVAMLGIGVAERSGLLSAAVRALVLSASPRIVTVAIVFAGVISNTASEVGYVVLIPLAGAVYYSLGRHPLAGMAAAFAGVSGGYSANLLIGTIDPLLAGITEEAAQLIDPAYQVTATASYYFMAASTFLVTIIGSLVSIFIVEPKLGRYDSSRADPAVLKEDGAAPLSGLERKGLWVAGLAVLGVLGLMALTLLPEWGMLRDPVTGDQMRSPFFTGFAVWILLFFLIVGFAYGKVVGTVKNDRDVIDGMASGLSTLGLYLVIVFFAAQFVAFFNWSNLGAITAVNGAVFLQETGLTGPALFIGFIAICAFVNLMLGSASAQWALTAPIFVPMLMLIGYSPEVIQTAYRIGDSTTNIITPMMSYFGLILAWATRYDKNVGIGTMIAMMLPYSIFFTLAWSAMFFLWVFGFGLPVGPGSPTYYAPG
ncbi:MAG: AbgT family transporter [Brevundimonas sp.]|uniref:AbgT family transporter n=1 Tax=Brevundimonas sp. TaxID=1871086 RepID=UPI0027354659|nr:AbgT family transporter [Brevundimonas sp.]MDP3658083.1 AbgT family transporter [Brevundimonas sp.]MDZ4111655.1 AbgT family transporter [Brevundimonas sp.]